MSEGTPPPPPPPPDQNPYGAPAGGSTPPPPPPPPYGAPGPGGYGAPPPPPPPGVGAGGYDAVESIKYGWSKFSKNPGPFIAAAAIVLVIGGLFSFLGQMVADAIFNTTPHTTVDSTTGAVTVDGGGTFAGFMASALVSFVSQVISALAIAGLLKMAFDVVDGRAPDVGSMLQGWDKVQLLIASVLTSLLTAIGIVLCILPGIVVAVLTGFTTAMVVDRKLGAVDAIKASVDFVRSNVGAVLLWILLAFVCAVVGTIACVVGLLVALPVIMISQAHTVRTLGGQQVAPVV